MYTLNRLWLGAFLCLVPYLSGGEVVKLRIPLRYQTPAVYEREFDLTALILKETSEKLDLSYYKVSKSCSCIEMVEIGGQVVVRVPRPPDPTKFTLILEPLDSQKKHFNIMLDCLIVADVVIEGSGFSADSGVKIVGDFSHLVLNGKQLYFESGRIDLGRERFDLKSKFAIIELFRKAEDLESSGKYLIYNTDKIFE